MSATGASNTPNTYYAQQVKAAERVRKVINEGIEALGRILARNHNLPNEEVKGLLETAGKSMEVLHNVDTPFIAAVEAKAKGGLEKAPLLVGTQHRVFPIFRETKDTKGIQCIALKRVSEGKFELVIVAVVVNDATPISNPDSDIIDQLKVIGASPNNLIDLCVRGLELIPKELLLK